MIHTGGFSMQTGPNGVPYVVCDALCASGAVDHLFTTRLGGVSTGAFASMNLTTSTGDDPAAVEENLRRLLPALHADRSAVCRTHQVHGDVILPVSHQNQALFAETPPECDGLTTQEPGLVLFGKFADCVPVLLCDPVRRACAVIHAGWHGTVQRIVQKGVRALAERYGSNPADCIAAVGPYIGSCCFLTHEDVSDAVQAVLGAEAARVMTASPDGRTHIDLKQVNALLLAHCGVGEIYVSTDCTCCRPETYFSHRRDGLARGSMAALIAVREMRKTT